MSPSVVNSDYAVSFMQHPCLSQNDAVVIAEQCCRIHNITLTGINGNIFYFDATETNEQTMLSFIAWLEGYGFKRI